MKTLQYAGKGVMRVIDVPVPVPGEGELLMKVVKSALCGSEKSDFLGEEPLAMNTGHEMVGYVEEPNGSKRFRKGDRINVHVTVGCGECHFCSIGMQQFCKEMHVVFGGHSEYVAVPERACVPIPDDISYDNAVLIGADTIGVAYRASKHIRVRPGLPVLVLGAGPIGLGAISLLRYMGCTVIVSEVSEYRRDYALKIGAHEAVDPTRQDLSKVLEKYDQGAGISYIVECTGNGRVQEQAMDLIGCGGTVIFCGENSGHIQVSPSAHFIHKEAVLTGVWYQSNQDFSELIQLSRAGYDALPLISHWIKPEELPKVGCDFYAGKTAKVVVDWM